MGEKQFRKYLLFSFLSAWILQVVASVFAWQGNRAVFQIILAVSMFCPLIAAMLAGNSLKDLHWKPVFKGRWKSWLAAWFLPAVLTMLGAGIYFLLFPSHLDLSGSYLAAAAGEEALQQLEAAGMTYTAYLMGAAVQALLTAPLINMIPALGEEAGWRGFMYPYLKQTYGKTKGRIIGGVIWGVWHWPVMILAGYEYGTGYFGAPVTGILLFCVITCALGIFMDEAYERTGSIFAPSIAHGAFNAWATFPPAMSDPALTITLLGPAPVGLVAALPMIILAALILRKK